MNEVTIGITTRYRYDMLMNCLDLIRANTRFPHQVIIIFDEDIESYKKIEPLRKKYNITNTFVSDKNIECVSATNKIFEFSPTDHFIYLNDDHEPGPYWFLEARETFMNAFNDGRGGLLSFNDGIQDGEIACAGLTSKTFINTMLKGEFFHKEYIHYYGDTDFTERAKIVGRYIYCPTSQVIHNHPCLGRRPDDDVKKASKKHWEHDDKIYQDRKENNFGF